MNLTVYAHATRPKKQEMAMGKKLSVLLVVVFTTLVSATVVAQTVRLSVEKEPFKLVMQEIQRQTGYSFIIKHKDVDKAKPVTLEVLNRDVLKVLPLLFENQPFTYEVSGKIINIVPKQFLPATGPGDGKPDSTFEIIGKVVDEQTNEPLQLVTVQILDSESGSIPLKTALTDQNGQFRLEHGHSPFFLRVSFIGYEEVKKEFAKTGTGALNIGQIGLIGSENVLEEINVTARRPILELITGGYRFNADNNIVGAATNMAELLRQVPGVIVDEIGGKIELLGRGTTVLINGRKVNISGPDLLAYLRALPSNEVLSIDVLTSPGAEFDASGDGGILDIRLKKRSELGFFGSASAGVSTLWRTDESLNLNLKVDKVDVSVGYNFSVGKNLYRRDDIIKNYTLPDSSYLFMQSQVIDELQRSHSVRTNVIYNLDTSSAISVNYWYAYLFNNSPNERHADILNRNNNLQRRVKQNDVSVLNNDFHILDAVYDKEFGSKNKLSVGLNYSNYNNKNTIFFNRHAYNIDGTPRNSSENESRDLAVLRPYDIWVLNADFTSGLGKHYELKLGAKYNAARTKSGFESIIITDQGRLLDENISNDIGYDENIMAAYSSLSGKHANLSFTVGLRMESFNYTLRSHTINEQVKNNHINLFPNVSFRYDSKDTKNSLSLSANRRIDRPHYRDLNPFALNDNIGYVSSGNPQLQPYFTNRLDMQFSHQLGKNNSLILAVYGNSSENIFSRITRYNDDLNTPEINSYNDYHLKQLGGYLMLQNRFWDKVNVSTYLSVQRPSFRSNVSEDSLLPGITSFTGSVNTFINVLPKTTVQVLGFYTSNKNSFQTNSGPTGYITMGVQQKALGNKLNIRLNFEDIFDTQGFPVALLSDVLSLESLNKRTSRHVKLSLTYNFGQSFESRERRKVEQESRVN